MNYLFAGASQNPLKLKPVENRWKTLDELCCGLMALVVMAMVMVCVQLTFSYVQLSFMFIEFGIYRFQTKGFFQSYKFPVSWKIASMFVFVENNDGYAISAYIIYIHIYYY